MGKWTNAILNRTDAHEAGEHIPLEDLARLAEGEVGSLEREVLIRHVNRCAGCYETLKETLVDLSRERKQKRSGWLNTRVYALAASIILILLIGGHYLLQHPDAPPEVVMASLTMDQNLRNMLLEGGGGQWSRGDQVQRLSALLNRKGVKTGSLKGVFLKKPYFQSKDLFGPRETLEVRIENGVAYLEVVREQ